MSTEATTTVKVLNNNTNLSSAEIIAKLKKASDEQKINSSSRKGSHEYEVYYKLTKADILQNVIKIKKTIFDEIKEINTFSEYDQLKSFDHRKKDIRNYIQRMYKEEKNETTRQKKIAEFKSDLVTLCNVLDKENKK